MKKVFTLVAIVTVFLSGCASVPMETPEKDMLAKQFKAPSEGNSGLYIYRKSGVGGALKKDVWVDDACVGETAQNVFFYEEVLGGQEHKVSTESEFSPNHLIIKTEPNQNYFINQYIKMGLFVGGADLKVVDEKEGKEDISKLNLAVGGICSQ